MRMVPARSKRRDRSTALPPTCNNSWEGASYVAGLAPDARHLDRGKPRDEDTEGGNQPADKSLINRRLSLRSQLCAAKAFLADGVPRRGRSTAPRLLTANIRD
jgi:hypothetical protein